MPPGAVKLNVSPAQRRVLAAVMDLYERDGHVTYMGLMARVSRARSTIQKCLISLREAGLVEWDDGKVGTLRPTFVRVT